MFPLFEDALDLNAYHPGVIAGCYFVAAAVCLALAVLVVTGRGSAERTFARRAFGVNVGIVVLVLIAIGGRHSAATPAQAAAAARVAVAGFACIGPSTLSFVCALIGWRDHLRAARGVAWAVGLAGAAASLLTSLVIRDAVLTGEGLVRVHAGQLLPLVSFVVVTQLAIALAVCASRARATPDATLRHQLRAVLLAYAVGGLGALDVVRLWAPHLPPSSFLCLTVAAGILTYAARVHHLLDTPELGWRALAWLVASALVAAPAPLLLVSSQGWGGWRVPAVGAVALETLFLGIMAYAWSVQPAIDDLFLRRRRDLARDLEALAETLLVVRTAPALADEVRRACQRALYARTMWFAVRDEGGWRAILPAGASAPREEDPVVLALREKRQVLTRGDVDALPASADREALARWMDGARAAVLVPLALPEPRAGLFGLLALGPRRDGSPFVAMELAFLRRLGATVADSLAAARLYDRRHHLRAELEEKVKKRAAELARARDGLVRAQDKLVAREKMATLGLVVGGVAADLEAAVDEVARAVPELERDLRTCDAAAARGLAALPDDEATRAWLEGAALEHVRHDAQPLVAAIAEGARRARAIAGDLSLFAGPSAPRTRVDLAAEAAAALRLLQPELAGGVEVSCQLPERLPAVAADPRAIGQVLLNLLVNAAQAIEGAGRISVSGRHIESEARVELAVRDSGRGIAPEHLSRIFEPFFTTKAPGNRGGSGLGLFVSYGIVQRLGGELLVESEPGKGSTFRLLLPVA